MYDKMKTQSISRIILVFILGVLMLTLVIPGQNVSANLWVNSSVRPDRVASVGGDYLRLKASYVRNAEKISGLKKDHAKLLAMVDRLRNKNNKKWVEMRVLYYDFNSSYQSALSHSYEARLLIKNHPGFSSSGKVENESMAKWTVERLRNAVTGLIARINQCNSIMNKATKLLKSAK